MALAALLRPSFNLYSPRQRSANDAFPTSRPNSSGTRQAMQPARINTSSRSGLPRDPEQWTDEDLATCARRHFRPEPTELLLGLIRQFRLTPVALWFLQMDDEELPRLSDGNTELQEQVIDLAIHIRPAVSPTTPRRMNAMQLQAVLDIPEPAPPPPPPPEEPEVVEDDDDDAARSVVSDWALEEQPYEGQGEAVEETQHPDTHATEHEPFPLPGGALGLDTTGGQQAETPAEAAPEHVEEPEEPEQATEPERAEDLIQFGEDETAEDQSVSISHIDPDNAAETEAAEVGVQDAPAEDALSSDEEDEHSEHRRAVLVHDESGSQDDFESVEPSQTGATSEVDLAADDDSSATATAQPETQVEELVAEVPVTDEQPSAPTRELPATTETSPATAVESLAMPAEELPASTEEPLSTENPAPTEARPSAGAEEHIAEDSAACPDTTVHEDAQAPQEETPELEALSDDLTLVPKGSATPQVVTETEVAEEQRQDEEGQRSDSPAVTEDVQTTGEVDAALATRSETLEEPALAGDSHPADVEATAVQDGQHDASEHAESQEQALVALAEPGEESLPGDTPSESLSTQDTQGEQGLTQDTHGESQSPAAEPPLVSENPAESEDAQLTTPVGDAEDDTTGAQHSSGATPADNSLPNPDVTPEEGDTTVQSTTNAEHEHQDDGGEDDRTTLPQTTVAPISATASSQSTHMPSESSPSSPIQQQAESEASQPRRAFDMQSPPSLSVSTTSPVSFSMSIANKLSSFGGFGAKSPYSPSSLAFSFSNAASGFGRSATPSKEISQLPSPSGIAGPRSASEPVQSPVEREAPPVPTEAAGDSPENPTPALASEPEARSAVEGDVAEDVADHVEDAMTSSVLQEGGEAPADHADPVLGDAPSGGEAAAEASAEAQEEVEGFMVLVSPTTLEKPLLDREQESPQLQKTGESGEADGSLETGWQTIGDAQVAQANVQEGESSVVTSPTTGGPAADPEEAEEEGGEDEDNEAGSEGDKPEGANGGGAGASKRKRKKAPGSKKKKGKKGK
ncbi:hypothetical protein VTO73DRAFT_8309 [Trametes versicolor]